MSEKRAHPTTTPSRGRRIAFWAGPTALVVCAVLARVGVLPEGLSGPAMTVAGLTVWMAAWWISECVPIAVTSLLPAFLLPALGILPSKAAVQPYMSPFIVLLMAGFMAALAIERWNLHRRLALHVLLRVGTSPSRLVLGMMVACAFCSMWISNTATTLMMLPIGLALLARGEDALGEDAPELKAFGAALFLGLAYSASVGGLGTPIGTPPNLIFLGVYQKTFPDAEPITFLDWLGFGIPVVLVFVPAIWLYLTRVALKLPRSLPLGGRDVLKAELSKLGRMGRDERMVGAIFGVMALLWITRRIHLGEGGVVGWAPLLGIDKDADDSTVALFGALLLFVWPSKSRPGDRLLDWGTARRIPWSVLLLFGGGIALAQAFVSTGLSGFVAAQLTALAELPAPLLILAIALTVTFLTEVTSNTATATILMPVLAAFAMGAGIAPTQVMIPAALSASCAFMLPVATAPNAIVYGSGRVPIQLMARIGFKINIGGAVAITLLALALL